MFKAVLPHLISFLLSNSLLKIQRKIAEIKRKTTKQPHCVTVFISINDPHSYLLLQVLTELQQRFNLSFNFHTVLNRQPEMFPTIELWDNNAWQDALFLADLYQLDFPNKPPSYTEVEIAQVTAQLLHFERHANYLNNALQLFHTFWSNSDEQANKQNNIKNGVIFDTVIIRTINDYQPQLLANESLLKDSGHYLSATLHYGSEWYWGLNRLQYLEKRLNALFNDESKIIKFNRLHNLCKNSPIQDINKSAESANSTQNKEPIVIYWSIRSPYSYLGLTNAIKLSHHYRIPLEVKPILPMVMRGMAVPKNKKMYIIKDTKRESLQYDIAFGKVADPLGEGVKRCYALFDYAKSQGKAIEYLKVFAESVWALGIRAETDSGLKLIVENSGLNWQEAQHHLTNNNWHEWVQQNLLELNQHNLWGVPSFKYKQITVFGQDQLLQIENAIIASLKL